MFSVMYVGIGAIALLPACTGCGTVPVCAACGIAFDEALRPPRVPAHQSADLAAFD